MIIVSACLLGENCKYSGGNNKSENVIKYLENKEYILVCPEQLGGLSTPRDPSEIITTGKKDGHDVLDGSVKVLSNKGIDVTSNFIKGAEETLKIAKECNAKKAILALYWYLILKNDLDEVCGYILCAKDLKAYKKMHILIIWL